MDYANTTNVEFIVDPKVLFHGWLIYSYLQIFKLIKCEWLPWECADWFSDNIMTWTYCLHRRHSMSRQKKSIFINEHALNREPFPLTWPVDILMSWRKYRHARLFRSFKHCWPPTLLPVNSKYEQVNESYFIKKLLKMLPNALRAQRDLVSHHNR